MLSWKRAGFERTLDEVSQVARQYRISQLETDQFSAQAVMEGFQRRGVDCQVKTWNNDNKSQAFARLKAGLATRTVELPEDDGLTHELMNLEARPTPSGMTRIAAVGSGHDDKAVVLAALAQTLLAPDSFIGVLYPLGEGPEDYFPKRRGGFTTRYTYQDGTIRIE